MSTTANTLALPLRLGAGGALAAVPSESPRAVAQSVALAVATPIGDRRAVPLFGSVDQLFLPTGAVFVDRAAIARWEDRATDDVVQEHVRAAAGAGS